MRPLTAVLLGAGARGRLAYAPYAVKYPHELRFVAVAEPVEERRIAFVREHGIAPEGVFSDWMEVLERPRMADIALICTQDRMHRDPTIKALELGYHVLLEKPMSPEPEECIRMQEAAEKHNRLLSVCHVLRYTPYWQGMKAVLDRGDIGAIVSVQLNENVGFYHYAHSFVRGNWRSSTESSPMILAKSCHDMDLLSWLFGRECIRVSSFGGLSHFHPGEAPEGAPGRCLDGCPAEADCSYHAPRFYLSGDRYWAGLFTEDTSEEGILEALKAGPYGRCVYRSDNDVVDHQAVILEFDDGSTALFSMCGFTHDVSRSIQIMGTKGEIRGCMEENRFTVHEFRTGSKTEYRNGASEVGHGGGDDGIMRSFLREVRSFGGKQGLTSPEASVRGHLMAFAAEESRRNGGRPVNLRDFRSRYAGDKVRNEHLKEESNP